MFSKSQLLKESDACSTAQARVARERQLGGDPAVRELLRAQTELGEDRVDVLLDRRLGQVQLAGANTDQKLNRLTVRYVSADVRP